MPQPAKLTGPSWRSEKGESRVALSMRLCLGRFIRGDTRGFLEHSLQARFRRGRLLLEFARQARERSALGGELIQRASAQRAAFQVLRQLDLPRRGQGTIEQLQEESRLGTESGSRHRKGSAPRVHSPSSC